MYVNRDRTHRLRRVEQDRHAGCAQRSDVHHLPADPGDVRAGDQTRAGADLARQLGERHDAEIDAVALAQAPQRREQPGVLLVAGQDLIAAREP